MKLRCFNWKVEFKQVGGEIFQRSIEYLIDKVLHHLFEWHQNKVQIENVSVFHACVNSRYVTVRNINITMCVMEWINDNSEKQARLGTRHISKTNKAKNIT